MKIESTELDNDTTGEVISLDGNPTDDGAGNTPEDRGDNLPGDADVDTLKAVVGSAPDDDGEAIDAKPSDPRIPKSRLDEVINQREMLKEQLAEANRKLQASATAALPPSDAPPAAEKATTPATSLKDLRAQHREAMMDGDMDKAAQLDDLIDAEVIRIAEARFEEKQTTKVIQTSLQNASAQALTEYPYLDTPEGAEALELIVMSRDRKITDGMEPAKALLEAVKAIAPRFAPISGDPDKGLQDTGASKDTRTANALLRGATDSTQQPPSIQAGVGNRATAAVRVDVTKLSEEQFESLPDAEKRRLRGD